MTENLTAEELDTFLNIFNTEDAQNSLKHLLELRRSKLQEIEAFLYSPSFEGMRQAGFPVKYWEARREALIYYISKLEEEQYAIK